MAAVPPSFVIYPSDATTPYDADLGRLFDKVKIIVDLGSSNVNKDARLLGEKYAAIVKVACDIIRRIKDKSYKPDADGLTKIMGVMFTAEEIQQLSLAETSPTPWPVGTLNVVDLVNPNVITHPKMFQVIAKLQSNQLSAMTRKSRSHLPAIMAQHWQEFLTNKPENFRCKREAQLQFQRCSDAYDKGKPPLRSAEQKLTFIEFILGVAENTFFRSGIANCSGIADLVFLDLVLGNQFSSLGDKKISYIEFYDTKGQWEETNTVVIGPWPKKGCIILDAWLGRCIIWQGTLKSTPILQNYDSLHILLSLTDSERYVIKSKCCGKYLGLLASIQQPASAASDPEQKESPAFSAAASQHSLELRSISHVTPGLQQYEPPSREKTHAMVRASVQEFRTLFNALQTNTLETVTGRMAQHQIAPPPQQQSSGEEDKRTLTP